MLLEIYTRMNAETLSFIVCILFLNTYFHLHYTPANIYKAPAILTTIGIFGTFVGFGFGLWDFDASNIQKSVPHLIDGVKTEVWVSACGILSAITIKMREIFWGVPKKITS